MSQLIMEEKLKGRIDVQNDEKEYVLHYIFLQLNKIIIFTNIS